MQRDSRNGSGLCLCFPLWANFHGGFNGGSVFNHRVVVALIPRLKICVEWKIVSGTARDEPVLSWDVIRLVLSPFLSLCCDHLNPLWLASLCGDLRITDGSLHDRHPAGVAAGVVSRVTGRPMGSISLGLIGLMAGWYRRAEPVRWVLLALMLDCPFAALAECHSVFDRDLRWRQSWVRQRQIPSCVAFLCCKPTLPALSLCYPLWRRRRRCMPWEPSTWSIRVWQSGRTPDRYFLSARSIPSKRCGGIRAHRDEAGTRLYNDYSYGGFLLWQLPGERIFIDGRMLPGGSRTDGSFTITLNSIAKIRRNWPCWIDMGWIGR